MLIVQLDLYNRNLCVYCAKGDLVPLCSILVNTRSFAKVKMVYLFSCLLSFIPQIVKLVALLFNISEQLLNRI